MKMIGLVGGLSWYSTVEYYRVINEQVQERIGGHASASVALQSVDFAQVRACQQSGDWAEAGRILGDAARRCEAAGADLVLICSNLMHKVYDDVAAVVDVPVVHIADAVAAEAAARGWSRLGLLGTRWVMEEPFYGERLGRQGIGVVVPQQHRELVDRVIFEELTQGVVRAESRAAYAAMLERLREAGAQAVVLAFIDSMRAHATRAVDLALDSPVTAAAPHR
jgi:aspartate racemase